MATSSKPSSRELEAVARRQCRHSPAPPCVACLIAAARADERVAVELEQPQAPVCVDWRATAAQRMRATGAKVTYIMWRFGVSYGQVMAWLHTTPSNRNQSPGVPRAEFSSEAPK